MAITKVTTAMKTAPTSAEVTAHVTAFDDNELKNDIALLGFKIAAGDSAVKYSLSNQVIDDFQDASGISAGDSTNENREASGKYFNGAVASVTATGGTTSTSGSYTFHYFTSSGDYVTDASQSLDVLLIAGGGGGGRHSGGGGGAGGLIYQTGRTVGAGTYAYVHGAGGATRTSDQVGITGSDATWNGLTAKGGGGGGYYGTDAGTGGGSSGGSSRGLGAPDAATQTSQAGDSGTYGFGNVGGSGNNGAPPWPAGGGGGAGAAGGNTSASASGAGGAGKEIAIFSAFGVSGWFAGGGGGQSQDTDTPGAGGSGGGGVGGDGTGDPPNGAGKDGTDYTGSGGGGSSSDSTFGTYGASGGDGTLIIRRPTGTLSINNLTLVSASSTAEVAPTKGDLVFTYSDGAGTATYSGGSPTIQAYISRNGSAYTSAVTLTKVGTTGTQTILAAHDVDLSGITAGTAMRYKITTTGQSASLETRIHAVSLGWS